MPKTRYLRASSVVVVVEREKELAKREAMVAAKTEKVKGRDASAGKMMLE